jgi:hypothetical protein
MLRDEPLFIVGMPRSGTKLIRDLLNTHSKIAIPDSESHFIPYFVRKYGNQPDFSATERIRAFIDDLTGTAYYINTRNAGINIDRDGLVAALRTQSWSEIFRFILLSGTAKTNSDGIRIWGDKTPGYVRHIDLLATIYPRARFLHIVRDPRDYARSAHRAWGKNPFRAAATWQRTMSRLLHDKQDIANPLLQIRYEDLTRDSERVLRQVLDFLSIDYERGFGILRKPAENLGDAAGSMEILANNSGKYRSYFTPAQMCTIERICAPAMQVLGYGAERCFSVLIPSRMAALRWMIADGYNSLRFHVRDKGWRAGARYFLLLHRKSSWRDA